MSSSAVVGALDPGDDRDPQLVAGVPVALVEDVVLQERDESISIAALSPQAPTRPMDPTSWWRPQAVDESSTSKLRASVAVHDAPGHVDAVSAAACDG